MVGGRVARPEALRRAWFLNRRFEATPIEDSGRATQPLVYSVGPDRKDDGGLVEWPRPGGGGGDDILFQIGE